MTMKKHGKKSTIAIALAVICLGTLAGCATFGGGEKNPLVGTWNLNLDWGGGETGQILVVNSDLTGTLADSRGEWTSDLSNVTIGGNAVSFDFLYNGPGGYDANFDGTITGNILDGDISIGGKNASVEGIRN